MGTWAEAATGWDPVWDGAEASAAVQGLRRRPRRQAPAAAGVVADAGRSVGASSVWSVGALPEPREDASRVRYPLRQKSCYPPFCSGSKFILDSFY